MHSILLRGPNFATPWIGDTYTNPNSIRDDVMSNKTDPKHHDPHYQEIPAHEVQHTKAGARGVRSGGNAGAMGDPVSDQSQHNYQVSRDTDMTQHAENARSKFNETGGRTR
jgi:hypothetical protein